MDKQYETVTHRGYQVSRGHNADGSFYIHLEPESQYVIDSLSGFDWLQNSPDEALHKAKLFIDIEYERYCAKLTKEDLLAMTASERESLLMTIPSSDINRLTAQICLGWRLVDGTYYYENHQKMRWLPAVAREYWGPVPYSTDPRFEETHCGQNLISLARKLGLTVNFSDPDYVRKTVIAGIELVLQGLNDHG